MGEATKVADPDGVYAQVALNVDQMIGRAIGVAEEAYPGQHEAIRAGVMGALVRLTVGGIIAGGHQATVYEVNKACIGGINRIAEQVVKAQAVRIPEVDKSE